jgi:outer membrane lipoprotein
MVTLTARGLGVGLLAWLLGACAAPQYLAGPTPNDVILGQTAVDRVRWGGRIVQVRNLRERTLIEVLGLPLDRDGRPQSGASPQGRFIVERAGFLEPHLYAENRLLEVEGRLDGFTDGRVGEAPYRYPVVVADRLRLWDGPAPGHAGGPSVVPRVGIGIGTGSSGTRVNGGIGIGIGF